MKDHVQNPGYLQRETDFCERSTNVQQVVVFQQNGSALSKVEGIRRFGGALIALKMISIDAMLPAILDDATDYFPPDLIADLILDYLKHPDLSDELARLCSSFGLPLIASGKKSRYPGVFTPPT
jgi:hypothetical protein